MIAINLHSSAINRLEMFVDCHGFWWELSWIIMDFLDLAVIFTCSTTWFPLSFPSSGWSPDPMSVEEEVLKSLRKKQLQDWWSFISRFLRKTPWFVHWTTVVGTGWWMKNNHFWWIQESAFDRACFRAFDHLSMSGGASNCGNCGNWRIKGPRMGWNQFFWQKQSLPLKWPRVSGVVFVIY